MQIQNFLIFWFIAQVIRLEQHVQITHMQNEISAFDFYRNTICTPAKDLPRRAPLPLVACLTQLPSW